MELKIETWPQPYYSKINDLILFVKPESNFCLLNFAQLIASKNSQVDPWRVDKHKAPTNLPHTAFMSSQVTIQI